MTHNDMEWQGSGAATSPVSQWQERVMTRLQPHVMIEVRHDSFSCESPLQHSATLSHISRQICLSRMWMSHVVHMYDIHMSVVICARVSCHTYVLHDSSTCVCTWARHDSFTCVCTSATHISSYIYTTWLIYMCVHTYIRHDSFTCVCIHIYDMTHLHVCVQVCDTTHLHECAYVQHTYRQLPRIYKNHTLSHTLIK